MKRLSLWLLAVLLMPAFAWATEELGVVGQQSIDVTRSGGSATAVYPMTKTATGSLTGLDTLIAGENQAATGANASGVMTVEFNYLTTSAKTADFQVKAGAGFVHNIVCIGTDAAATVGTIKIFDSLTETGTELFSWTTVAVALNTQPLVFPIDAAASTGIYLGYTTIADIQCTVSYR